MTYCCFLTLLVDLFVEIWKNAKGSIETTRFSFTSATSRSSETFAKRYDEIQLSVNQLSGLDDLLAGESQMQ